MYINQAQLESYSQLSEPHIELMFLAQKARLHQNEKQYR